MRAAGSSEGVRISDVLLGFPDQHKEDRYARYKSLCREGTDRMGCIFRLLAVLSAISSLSNPLNVQEALKGVWGEK